MGPEDRFDPHGFLAAFLGHPFMGPEDRFDPHGLFRHS